jgi:hypothetical protein
VITIDDEGVIEGRRWKSLFTDLVDHEREVMGGMGPFERTWLKEQPGTREWTRKLMKGVDEGFARVVGGVIIPFASGAASSQFGSVEGQPAAPPSSFTAVNTTNVETNLWVPAIWTPIPANSMVAGKVYQGNAGGVLGTSSAAPTATWTPRCGQSATPSSNVTLGATTGTTMIASLAAVPWTWTFMLAIRSLGLAASGCTATGNGFIVIGGLTTAAGIVQSMGGTVATTLDNTAATGLILSNTWGTNNASNTVTCQWTAPVVSLN